MSLTEDLSKWFKVWVRTKNTQFGLVAFVVLILVMFGNFSYWSGAMEYGPAKIIATGGEFDWSAYSETNTSLGMESGYLYAETEVAQTRDITNENIYRVTFILTWQDEADSEAPTNIPGIIFPYENQPDEFGLEVVSPWGDSENASGSNSYDSNGGYGEIIVTYDIIPEAQPSVNGTGAWNITIEMKSAGMFISSRPNAVLGIYDGSNDWDLEVMVDHYV